MMPTVPDAVCTSIAEREIREDVPEARARRLVEVEPPRPAVVVDPQVVLHGVDRVDGELLVVPPAGVEPGVVEPLERHRRLGTAVDQIADREEAVGGGIELHLVEQGTQVREHPVDVSDDEVASGIVARVPGDDAAGTKLRRGQIRWELTELHGRRYRSLPALVYAARPVGPSAALREKIVLTRSRSAGVSTPGPDRSRAAST